ncbi:MAG: hypothetical protein BAJALOKI2v1_300030 [Promethearchaeota archaeon]|nr:MAG: hypothetical protein BAJALOKI2v1_300030 [Candidatus Lokiarchaeota archaeon]
MFIIDLKMDKLRYNRYRDKINYIIDNIKKFSRDPKNKLEMKDYFTLPRHLSNLWQI